MKRSILFFLGALTVLLISGCLKQDNVHVEDDKSEGIFYVMSLQDNSYEVEKFEKSEFEKLELSPIESRNGNSSSATGMVQLGTFQANFNAIQNNGGNHGNTHMSDNGEFAFWLDVKFDSECLYIIDNIAFWGGTITNWEVNDGGVLPFDVGWSLVWATVDNGEGANADPDEMGEALIIYPPNWNPDEFGYSTLCDASYGHYGGATPDGHTHGYMQGDMVNSQVND